MDLQLEGHVAMVTGSSAGIGRAIVERLAEEGCAVLVHGRDHDAAREVRDGIRHNGGRADLVLGDLQDAEARARLASAARNAGVDIVVNNAGPFAEDEWSQVDADAWSSVYDANVVSCVDFTAALVDSLRERGWGRVVTIGSRAALTPLPNMAAYSASKAAVVNLTISLAKHLEGSGVTANCVSPGVILTPSLQKMFRERADDGRSWEEIEPVVVADYAPNPSGRLGRPEDIATAVAFLASPLSGYVNAAVLRVDGGITGAV